MLLPLPDDFGQYDQDYPEFNPEPFDEEEDENDDDDGE